MPGWKDLAITDHSKTAVTTQDAVQTVMQVEGAIGFAPYSTSLASDVAILDVDGDGPTDPGYPSATLLQFAYIDGSDTPEMTEFIDFVRSERGRRLLEAFGAVPVAP